MGDEVMEEECGADEIGVEDVKCVGQHRDRKKRCFMTCVIFQVCLEVRKKLVQLKSLYVFCTKKTLGFLEPERW